MTSSTLVRLVQPAAVWIRTENHIDGGEDSCRRVEVWWDQQHGVCEACSGR
jgi:hypothetical protein